MYEPRLVAELLDTYGEVDPITGERYSSDVRRYTSLVKQKIPGVFFIPNGDRERHDFHLCVANYPVALGLIRVTNSRRSPFDTAFTIIAPKEINKKYPESVKESINPITAARNAAKYLTAPSMHTTVNRLATALRDARSHRMSDISDQKNRQLRDTFGYGVKDDVVSEMATMLQNGYPFASAQLQEKIGKFVEAQHKYDEKIADKPSKFLCVLHVPERPNTSQTERFILAELKENPKQRNQLDSAWTLGLDDSVKVCTANELPSLVEQVVPMLDMVVQGEYVEGYGVTPSKGLYFIEVRE